MDEHENKWDDDTILRFMEVHRLAGNEQAVAAKCEDFQITTDAYYQWVEQGCEKNPGMP